MKEDGHDVTSKDHQDAIFTNFIMNSLPIGILTVNPQMRVTSLNPWAESLTGYSLKEAMGRYCGDILRGGMCRFNCPLKTAIDKGHPVVRMETTIQNAAGKTIPVRLHTAALLDEEGGLIGAVEAFQDISPLKTMEREKDNLISMFAHDMKSSLTIIGGFVLRLLKKKAAMDISKQNKYLEIIQNETDKLEFLINDFLEFARLQTGKLQMNFQTASVDKELLELYEAYQSKAMQSGIELKFHDDNILPVINADPDRLRRVFTNLLDNAFKFTQKGGTIEIGTKETEHEVEIVVKDNGKGIKPDEIPFIFDIFHRGKDVCESTGAGIGLATVKAIVDGHGGRVTVESEPGNGSVFTVILPKNHRSKDKAFEYSLNDDRPRFPSCRD